MLAELYPLIRPALFALDPETAHRLTLACLSRASRASLILRKNSNPNDACRIMGLDFPNRVGLAAGLDKEGSAIDALACLGFGFIEVGTVTPLPQPGNPKPRMFRVGPAKALINRMGFNNQGLATFIANVKRRRTSSILGLNIGKNAATPQDQAIEDYLKGLRAVYPHADYVTVNISSPNTKGLRDLQNADALDLLLGALKEQQLRLHEEHLRYVPLVLKIAPDLSDAELLDIARRLVSHGIDGVIATNTTVSRDHVAEYAAAKESGGLSGAPLREKSNRVIACLSAEVGSRVPIIGVGGILSGADAAEKVRLGASLVQIYTGLIYRGPALISECVEALRALEGLS
jgi:dihydroorotate dehydrogenase